MNNKEDLRIIKTKNTLRDTLINLMKDKQFEEIKVADICNNALINRSTFYAHYTDKYELLVDLINSLKINLLNDLEKNKNIVNTREYYIELIKLLLNHITEKNDIYTKVFLNNHHGILMDILTDSVLEDINKRIKMRDEFEKYDEGKILKDLHERANKSHIDFIKFVLDKYPYHGYQKIDDIESKFKKSPTSFIRKLVIKYHPDRYPKNTQNEKNIYVIIHEISSILNNMYVYYDELKNK